MSIPVLEPRGPGRPPKDMLPDPRVPDPANVDFQTWALGTSPEKMHPVVLELLRSRHYLVQRACLSHIRQKGMKSGRQPSEKLEISACVLARLTIRSHLLDDLIFPDPEFFPLAEPPSDLGPFERHHIFCEILVHSAWDPFLDPDLLKRFERFEEAPRRRWTSYPMSIEHFFYGQKPTPYRVALATVADEDNTNPERIKERLRNAKRQADVQEVWRDYQRWLAEREHEAAELRACFDPFNVSLPFGEKSQPA